MILVDDIRYYHPGVNGHKEWCHMVSDLNLEELHSFAQLIGLRKSWFQGNHYDITPNRRFKAIQAGATAVNSRELVKRMYRG